jgi:hypothetical protein
LTLLSVGTQEAEKWRAEKYTLPGSAAIFLPVIFLLSSIGNREAEKWRAEKYTLPGSAAIFLPVIFLLPSLFICGRF